jgi:hypothetical protein
MSSKFQADAVFSIEGRGIVIQGTIVSGEIGRGMLVKIPGLERCCRVAAVEFIDGCDIPIGSLGLTLGSDAPNAEELTLLVKGKVLDIKRE